MNSLYNSIAIIIHELQQNLTIFNEVQQIALFILNRIQLHEIIPLE